VANEPRVDEAILYYTFSDVGLNRIVHRGTTKYYDPVTKGMNAMREAAGYLPTKFCGTGVRDVWSGRLKRYTDHSAEYATMTKV
jgi:hypothetical protein